MHTRLHQTFKHDPAGQQAAALIQKCVHCGFCNATCPTYQQVNDERDGPRGRIYLIKSLLEEGDATDVTQHHLDRCLTCRSCETTCPSGVQYGELLDIGRSLVAQRVRRPISERLIRWGIRNCMSHAGRFTVLLRCGQLLRPLLPQALRKTIPPRQQLKRHTVPKTQHSRFVVALAGCVQPGATPQTNLSAARVLDKLGIRMVQQPQSGCCGALSHHLDAEGEAKQRMRANIDAWWPAVEAGAEAIIATASGCGVMIKDYGRLLQDDPQYADKALRVSQLFRDLSEVLLAEDLSKLGGRGDPGDPGNPGKVAVHCPCTLQHGLGLPTNIEAVLHKVGIDTAATKDPHLCCGSAGTYSILQPQISQALLQDKVEALSIAAPQQIVTANIGCQLHLASAAQVPVRHWIELLDTADA